MQLFVFRGIIVYSALYLFFLINSYIYSILLKITLFKYPSIDKK